MVMNVTPKHVAEIQYIYIYVMNKHGAFEWYDINLFNNVSMQGKEYFKIIYVICLCYLKL